MLRFRVSFATFAELTNDERTRTFLTLEVGAGHDEVRLASIIDPCLRGADPPAVQEHVGCVNACAESHQAEGIL